MTKTLSNKRSSKYHTCGGIRIDVSGLKGMYSWPQDGPYTEEEGLGDNVGLTRRTPSQVGIQLVDPTATQGMRTLTNIRCSVVFDDYNADNVDSRPGFVGVLIKFPQNSGLEPFAQLVYDDLYVTNHPHLKPEWGSRPTFIPPSFVIDTFNLSNDTYPALEHFIPGPIVLESGDQVFFQVFNINMLGNITETTDPETQIKTRTITAQTLDFNCFVTCDYNISF